MNLQLQLSFEEEKVKRFNLHIVSPRSNIALGRKAGGTAEGKGGSNS
jgi:hypothetical protein